MFNSGITSIFLKYLTDCLHIISVIPRAMPIITAAATLRRALEDPNCFISAPGVYDGVSARIALSVGFDALYMVRAPQLPSSYGKYLRT